MIYVVPTITFMNKLTIIYMYNYFINTIINFFYSSIIFITLMYASVSF